MVVLVVLMVAAWPASVVAQPLREVDARVVMFTPRQHERLLRQVMVTCLVIKNINPADVTIEVWRLGRQSTRVVTVSGTRTILVPHGRTLTTSMLRRLMISAPRVHLDRGTYLILPYYQGKPLVYPWIVHY